MKESILKDETLKVIFNCPYKLNSSEEKAEWQKHCQMEYSFYYQWFFDYYSNEICQEHQTNYINSKDEVDQLKEEQVKESCNVLAQNTSDHKSDKIMSEKDKVSSEVESNKPATSYPLTLSLNSTNSNEDDGEGDENRKRHIKPKRLHEMDLDETGISKDEEKDSLIDERTEDNTSLENVDLSVVGNCLGYSVSPRFTKCNLFNRI